MLGMNDDETSVIIFAYTSKLELKLIRLHHFKFKIFELYY